MHQITLTGLDAIGYAEAAGARLHKYADPTDGEQDGLTVSQATAIAQEDPSLVWAYCVPYAVDVDMLGGASRFSGTLSDLDGLLDALAEQTGRPKSSFVLEEVITQEAGAVQPSEEDWNAALAAFVENCPELFQARFAVRASK